MFQSIIYATNDTVKSINLQVTSVCGKLWSNDV